MPSDPSGSTRRSAKSVGSLEKQINPNGLWCGPKWHGEGEPIVNAQVALGQHAVFDLVVVARRLSGNAHTGMHPVLAPR